MSRVSAEFTEFMMYVASDSLDGFILEMDGTEHGLNIGALSSCLRRVLCGLSSRDPAGERVMERVIDAPEWQFRFAGQDVFVITFAPCYGPDSARNTAGLNSVFIFLQPQASFNDNRIPRGAERGRLRERIRDAFRQNGQDYDHGTLRTIMHGDLEAPRMIKPLSAEDPIVRWWEESS